MKKYVTLSLTFFFLGALSVSAQTFSSQPAPVQYIVAPENPGPNSPVSIEVQGVGNFLGDSTVTWRLNGTTALSGTGEDQFSFTTGALGKTTTVSVQINSNQYGIISKTFTFNPSRIDLVWEAQTTVPPFFAGKALWSSGSSIKVIAFPEVMSGGKTLSTNGLSYQWKLNGQAQTSKSGVGRSTFSFPGDQLHTSATVSVDVYSGSVPVGHAEISIPVRDPELVLYLHDPLRGVLYNQTIQNPFTLNTMEGTIRAEPYYFGKDARAQGLLQYSWQLNGEDAQGPMSSRGELTLRQVGNGGGNASLFVSLQNLNSQQLLQGAQTTLSIIFGAISNQSNFSL